MGGSNKKIERMVVEQGGNQPGKMQGTLKKGTFEREKNDEIKYFTRRLHLRIPVTIS